MAVLDRSRAAWCCGPDRGTEGSDLAGQSRSANRWTMVRGGVGRWSDGPPALSHSDIGGVGRRRRGSGGGGTLRTDGVVGRLFATEHCGPKSDWSIGRADPVMVRQPMGQSRRARNRRRLVSAIGVDLRSRLRDRRAASAELLERARWHQCHGSFSHSCGRCSFASSPRCRELFAYAMNERLRERTARTS